VEFKEMQQNAKEIRDMFRDRLSRVLNFHHLIVHQYRHNINCKVSGAVYAVTEIEGAIPLIHGPTGCAFHHRLTPHRMHAPVQDMPSTDIDEYDVIYGGEGKLHKRIIETYQSYHPELIAILHTCVSGIIGDDIQGVIQEVDVPCAVIHVPSEGFAMDRWSSDMLVRDYAKPEKEKDSAKSPAPAVEAKARGCGFMAVMDSLVDQLMEKQDIEENSVNLETSDGFRRGLEEITRLFEMIGVRINTAFLCCTVDAIKRAPAAELNIVGWRGVRWAERMKNKFGTDYLRGSFSYSGYSTFDGTEKFLLDVAKKFNLEGEAEEVIREEKSHALQELDKYAKLFKNYDFALFPFGFFFNPYSVKTYVRDLKIPLKYVCIDTRRMNLPAMTISDETTRNMIRNMETMLEELDVGAELVVNPELSTIAKKVDYILGDRNRVSNYWNDEVHIIDTAISFSYRIGFNGLVELAAYLTREMKKPRNHKKRKTIISRFNYDEAYYPMLADNSLCRASREMWSAMWSLRSG
jgi:nitrogenase molybdenum-iron protein alpha/beta subunit